MDVAKIECPECHELRFLDDFSPSQIRRLWAGRKAKCNACRASEWEEQKRRDRREFRRWHKEYRREQEREAARSREINEAVKKTLEQARRNALEGAAQFHKSRRPSLSAWLGQQEPPERSEEDELLVYLYSRKAPHQRLVEAAGLTAYPAPRARVLLDRRLASLGLQ